MESPGSPSAAVSALMQQLKSGEISKMELFQQIAKLRANGVGRSTITGHSQSTLPASSAQPFAATVDMFSSVSVHPTPPAFLAPASSLTQSAATFATFGAKSLPSAAHPELQTRSITDNLGSKGTSVNIVEADADLLASGVSHDKVSRFSVQEWMASKSRSSATGQANRVQQSSLDPESVVGNDSRGYSAMQNLFFDHGGREETPPSINTVNARHQDHRESDLHFAPDMQHSSSTTYVYTPQRYYSMDTGGVNSFTGVAQGDQREREPMTDQGYIDFADHFRDDLDGGANRKSRQTAHESKANNQMSATSDGDKFHTRVTRWKSQKDAIREQMKQQLLQSELNECTFAPKVNPKSTKVVAKLRGRQSDRKDQTRDSPQAVSERLYQEADTYKAREQLAAKMKAEEEADLARECTFKPKINRVSSINEKVKPKYLDPPGNPSPSLAAATMEATARELQECTFQPKVNPISSEMASAQLYLQHDIYDRLSRPCCLASDGSSRVSRRRSRSLFGDEDEDDGSLAYDLPFSPRLGRTQDDFDIGRQHDKGNRRLSGNHARRSTDVRERPRSAGRLRSEEEQLARAKTFDGFLERQKFHEQARAKRIEQTKQQLTPGHKPNINKNSLMMMENGRKGDFLERITKYALRRENDTVKSKALLAAVSADAPTNAQLNAMCSLLLFCRTPIAPSSRQ